MQWRNKKKQPVNSMSLSTGSGTLKIVVIVRAERRYRMMKPTAKDAGRSMIEFNALGSFAINHLGSSLGVKDVGEMDP